VTAVPAANPAPAAVRVAATSVLCLVVSDRFQLSDAYQSVITVHIVNMVYAPGPFQRGVERFLGRVSGVVYGAAAAVLFAESPGLCLAAVVALQLVVWYAQAAGRLPYAGTHLGTFSASTAAAGLLGTPAAAVDLAVSTGTQIALGVVAADLVNFLTGTGGLIRVDLGKQPLTPLRREWVWAAVRVTGASIACMFLAHGLGLPTVSTMASAALITQSGQYGTIRWKAYQRGLGALLAIGYSIPVLHLLAHEPAFGLLLGAVFLAVFVGQVVNHSSADYAYFGQQFSQSAAMILAGPPAEVSDLDTGYLRLLGTLVGVAVATVAIAVVPARQ
jgi:uncharacterized membrane protein YccC